MSYALSAGLQTALYQRLTSTSGVTDLVGSAVFDAVPSGALPQIFLVLGAETVKDASDKSQSGAQHDFVISVVTDQSAFQGAKDVAAAVCDALVDAPLSLSRGSLIGLWFLKAKAVRTGTGDGRRIDLTFRARVEDN